MILGYGKSCVYQRSTFEGNFESIFLLRKFRDIIRRTEAVISCHKVDTSAGTGKLCILGHLGLVFIWSCFVSCLLFLLFYVSLRNLCSGTCRKIP